MLNIVLSVAYAFLTAVAVGCAIYCSSALRAANRRHGTSSLRVELDELRDSFEKNSKLLQRINQRTVMQERRAAAPNSDSSDDLTQQPGETVDHWKRRVRPRLIPAGKPARHA